MAMCTLRGAERQRERELWYGNLLLLAQALARADNETKGMEYDIADEAGKAIVGLFEF